MAHYKIRAYASERHPQLAAGTLLLETRHTYHVDIEIRAWRSRMAKGHPISRIEITRLDVIEPMQTIHAEDCTDADITVPSMRVPTLAKRRGARK